MKKIILSFLALGAHFIYSQETNIGDALRYGVESLNGTARYRAMGGAFGAVGGDLSSLNVNPAGSSIFNNNQAAVSATSFNIYNNANYFGTSVKSNDNTLDINQLGAVFVFKDQSAKSGWNKFTLGLNYEKVSHLDNTINSKGTNPFHSMGDYFLNKAQGIDVSYLETQPGESIGSLYNYLGENYNFDAQQAMLGYQGYVFDEDTSTSATNDYWTNVPTGGNYYHRNSITSKGYNGKFTANISGSYMDRLYIGMNLNFMFTDYTRTSSLYESNNNLPYSSGNTLLAAQFDNQLYTYGSGFSMNFGTIYKLKNNSRIGFSYETPTWYRLNDELTQRLQTLKTDGTTESNINVNPGLTNVYPTYKIQTPSKLTGSFAYVFGKNALLSIDYIYKDYAKTKFKPTNDGLYNYLNNSIKNVLSDNYELRLGGEYKIKQWSLRAGYRFEQSPYKNDYVMGDLSAYSGGLGYNFGGSRLDLSYTNEHRNYNQYLLTSGLNDSARIRNYNNNVTLTYVINF